MRPHPLLSVGYVAVHKARRVSRPNPPKATQRRREQFLRQAEKAVTISFMDGIKRFKQRIPKAQLDEMYRTGNYAGLYKTLPWDALAKGMTDSDAHVERARARAGEATIAAIDAKDVDTTQRLQVVAHRVLTSRPGTPTVANPEGRVKRMLPDIQGDARQHIKDVVAHGLETGMTPKQVANRIVEGLVLRKPQRDALTRYRTGLEQKGQLSQSQIDARVSRHEQRLLKKRAELIAVTETRIAASNTELQSWQTQQQLGLLEPDQEQVWLAEPDACEAICAPMNGKTIGLNDLWQLPDGRSVPAPGYAHPRCRCNASLV